MSQSNQQNINFSQEFMQQLIHAMGEGLYTLDKDGNCTFINPEGERLIGWTLDEIIGKNIHSIIHAQTAMGEFLPRENCPSAKSIATGDLYRSNSEVFKHKNSIIFPVSIVSEALYDNGEITGSVTVFRDISIEKQVEKQLENAKQQVAITTQLKNNLMSNMSHELRTPLNAILGLSHLSLQTDLSPTQANYLEKIQSSSHKLLNLINDILDLSRVESGKMEVFSTQFNINALFQDIENLLEAPASKKDLKLIFSIDPDLSPNRIGDVGKIKKILLNLAKNAIKFTDTGEIWITAKKVIIEKGSNSCLQFSIVDTGIGLTEDQLQNLFTDFSQGDSSASRQYEGMGLGLGYSKKLVELLGGTIGVNSRINYGSEFYFNLELPRLGINQAIKKPHILLVEDNKINQMVVKNILKKLQLEIETCENGLQALDAIANKHFDLVLMDVQMPIMDGIEATIDIRSKDHLQSLPIIALTGNDHADEIQRCFISGMNDHLVKPIKTEQLRLILEKWLSSSYTMEEQSKTTDQTLLNPVEGIDIQQGLKRLANNKKLYAQLLTDFVIYYQHSSKQLKLLLSENNIIEAESLAHSVKGVAGNIGAQKLAESSAKLEYAINAHNETNTHKTNTHKIGEALLNYEKCCDQLITALKRSGYQAEKKQTQERPGNIENKSLSNKASHSPEEQAETIELLKKLESYLQSYDGSTEEKFTKMLDIFEKTLTDSDIKDLKASIKRFCFDDALPIVQRLLAN